MIVRILYASVPGAQAEYLRVLYADAGPVAVPEGSSVHPPPGERPRVRT